MSIRQAFNRFSDKLTHSGSRATDSTGACVLMVTGPGYSQSYLSDLCTTLKDRKVPFKKLGTAGEKGYIVKVSEIESAFASITQRAKEALSEGSTLHPVVIINAEGNSSRAFTEPYEEKHRIKLGFSADNNATQDEHPSFGTHITDVWTALRRVHEGPMTILLNSCYSQCDARAAQRIFGEDVSLLMPAGKGRMPHSLTQRTITHLTKSLERDVATFLGNVKGRELVQTFLALNDPNFHFWPAHVDAASGVRLARDLEDRLNWSDPSAISFEEHGSLHARFDSIVNDADMFERVVAALEECKGNDLWKRLPTANEMRTALAFQYHLEDDRREASEGSSSAN